MTGHGFLESERGETESERASERAKRQGGRG